MIRDYVYQRNAAFRLIRDGSSLKLVRQKDLRAWTVNGTAGLIWTLIDGRRTHSEIEELLSLSYPEAAQTMRGEISATLFEFMRIGAAGVSGDVASRLSIAILTLITPDIACYARYSEAINRAYAESHGYQFIVAREWNFEDRVPTWGKVRMLAEHLPRVDYAFWLDADAVVTNFNITFEHFIHQCPDKHILACDDRPNGGPCINTGTVIMKNSDWSARFLRQWWNLGGRREYARVFPYDQKAFSDLYHNNTMDLAENLQIFPADAFNSDYPAPVTHKEDTFIMHLMTAGNDERQAIFRELYEKICT